MSSQENNVEYYTSEINEKEERKSIPDTDGIPQTMLDMTDENGMIQVQLERRSTIKKLSKNMYDDPTAGIREYVNNEARPCREAMRKGYENVTIHITIDSHTNNIIIEGRNSMGMSMQTFCDVYVVLGRSGNLDGTESGQFGFGRSSYLCLSDTMIFETWSRETGEKFGFIGKSGTSYEPIPKQHLSIKQHGTKITINIKPDIDLYDIITYVKRITKLLHVPVFLELTGEVKFKYTKYAECHYDVGVEQIGPESLAKMLGRETDIHINNDDYELVASLDYGGGACDYYLIGMPIKVDGGSPITSINSCIINIKNERKYVPTSSRDQLSSNSRTALNARIKADLKKMFDNVKINSIQDYYKNKRLVEIAFRCGNEFSNESIMEFVYHIYMNYFKRVSVDDTTGKIITSGIMRFTDIPHSEHGIYYTHNKNVDKIISFVDLNPEATVILPTGPAILKTDVIKSFKKYNVPSVSEYLKSHTASVDYKNMRIFYGGSNGYNTKILSSELEENVIKINESPVKFIRCIPQSEFNNFKFVRNSERLDGKGITLEKFCENAENAEYDTSDGVITGRQILDRYSNGIALYQKIDDYVPDCTLSKCKDYLRAKLVINNEFDKATQHTNTVCLAFAYIIRCKNLGVAVNLDFCGLPDDYAESMFVFVNKYTEQVCDGSVSDALGINVDGPWKFNAQSAISTVSAIQNIPVRLLYAHSYNNCILQHGYSFHLSREHTTAEEKRRLLKLITHIDRESDGKNIKTICLDVMKSQHKNISDEKTAESAVARAAFDILIHMYDGVKDMSERIESVLNHILCNNMLSREDRILGRITCSILPSTHIITITMDMQDVNLDDTCLLSQIVRRVTKDNRYHISSVSTDVRKCVMTVMFSRQTITML